MLVTNGKESTAVKLAKLFIGPVITAMLAFGGSYAAFQQKVASIATSVDQIVIDVKEMRTAQSALFKDYYLPRREEWSEHNNKLNRIQAEHDFMQAQIRDIYVDMRRTNGGKN